MTEALWQGPFGDSYTARQISAGSRRGPFWQRFFSEHAIGSALEAGCSVGGNLRWITQWVPQVYGIDINDAAVSIARARFPDAEIEIAPASAIPFLDASVDLVLTCGLLIHLDDKECSRAIREVFRVASKYVLIMEYFAPTTVMVPYRGQDAALWKRNWPLLVSSITHLAPVEMAFVGEAQGFDSVHCYLYRVER